MNVVGNNFAVLPITVASKASSNKRKRRSSVVANPNLTDDAMAVTSPSLLRPLAASTVGRELIGILKCVSGNQDVCRASTPNKLDKITFSPFNGVKVIPHRSSLAYYSPTCYAYDDE
jgi:hypothetical protein